MVAAALFNGPVCLTRTALHADYSGQLIFHDVVHSSSCSRSRVLSGIVEAGGEALLPAAVTLAQFKTWLTATTASKEAVENMMCSTLCTVVEVADALDDTDLAEWVERAARRLLHTASANRHNKQETSEAIADSLSNLPAHLQRRVLAHAAGDASEHRTLFAFLPIHLHQAVSAALTTDDKALRLCLTRHSMPLVRSLAALPASPPQLLSLNLHEAAVLSRCTAMTGQAWRETAPHLVRALQHHSHLTSLHLDLDCINPAAVQLLSPAIGTLTSLRSLHLQAHIDAETPAVLGRALAALPELRDLALVLSCGSNMRKRKRDVADPMCCLAALLSNATAVTSLSVKGTDDSGSIALSAFAPLRLPALVQLSISMTAPAALNLFLGHLNAPLTRLDLRRCMHDCYYAAAAEHVQLLFSRLSQFALLQRLELHCPTDAIESDDTIRGTVQLHAPPAIAVLRHLQHLHLDACLTTISQALQGLCLQAAHGRSPLTSLVICARSSGPSSAELDLWPQCIQRLGRLRLQHLDLHLAGSSQCSDHSLAPLLQHLTTLTALRVRGWDCLHSKADAAALQAICMPRLRKLHLLRMNVPAELHAFFASVLLLQSTLTNLAFTIKGHALNAAFLMVLVRGGPFRPWPELQHLSLQLSVERDNSDMVIEFARMLRSRTALTLHLDCPSCFDDVGGGRFYTSADRDAEVRYVEAAASRAAVSVSIGQEFPF